MSEMPLLNPLINAPMTITTVTPMATPRIVSAARILCARSEARAMPTPSNRAVTRYSWRSAAMGSRRAERLPQADLTGALAHRHEHDVHDHDAADHERHDHHARENDDENAADSGPESLHPLGRIEHEVVVLVGPQVVPAAHDPLRHLHGLAHLDLGPGLHQKGVHHAGRVHEALGRCEGGHDHEAVERESQDAALLLDHADHPIADATDPHAAAERGAIDEQPLGHPVAQDGHGGARAILLGGEGSSHGDPQVLDLEVPL